MEALRNHVDDMCRRYSEEDQAAGNKPFEFLEVVEKDLENINATGLVKFTFFDGDHVSVGGENHRNEQSKSSTMASAKLERISESSYESSLDMPPPQLPVKRAKKRAKKIKTQSKTAAKAKHPENETKECDSDLVLTKEHVSVIMLDDSDEENMSNIANVKEILRHIKEEKLSICLPKPEADSNKNRVTRSTKVLTERASSIYEDCVSMPQVQPGTDATFIYPPPQNSNATFVAGNEVRQQNDVDATYCKPAMNETLVLNGPIAVSSPVNNLNANDLMTDDESVQESRIPVKYNLASKTGAVKKAGKAIFSPFENSPVKIRVAAFEQLQAEETTTGRITRTKTKNKAKQEDEALGVQKRLIESIEQLLDKAEKLCNVLHLQMPPYSSETLGLFEEKKRLQKQVEKYEQQIEEKRKEVAGLERRRDNVCKSLGIEAHPLPAESLPTEKDISNLLEKIESLEQEKYVREEKYINIREEILAIVSELDVKPSLDSEKMVLSDDMSSFVLTDSNMKWLEEYHDSLSTLQEQTKAEITEGWEKLRDLWDLLEEDIQARRGFTRKHVGNSLRILEALKKEIKRCKDLKAANIQELIIRLRSQMHDLWDKCHFSAEQRDNFGYFQETYYTNDLLTFHKMEVDKLKKYYSENKEILSLLEKREKLWHRMLNLEERSAAPDRLKNRGGYLLKGEKERNKLHKNIPEIETKIFQLPEEYKQRTGNAFTSKGLTVQDIISTSYDTYNEEKKLKLSARKQQHELATASGKSPTNLATSSYVTITKRKRVLPLYSNAKRKKENAGLKSAPPKLQVNAKTVVRRYSCHSYDRKKRVEKLRRISNTLRKRKSPKTSCNTIYEDFEEEQACRSTFHADQSPEVLALPLAEMTNPCNIRKTLKRKPKDKGQLQRRD